jgi:hypothetical protein
LRFGWLVVGGVEAAGAAGGCEDGLAHVEGLGVTLSGFDAADAGQALEGLVVEPFQRLIEAGQLMAYRHEGFWQSMDTVRDRALLEDLYNKGCMPWKAHSQPKQTAELEAIAL